jgi:acyl-CoA thioester hydrolase
MIMSQNSFSTSFRVTWVDTDAAGVVHYSNYFRFFERAEEEFYRHLGFDFTNFREMGLWFPRVEAFCQYKKPARYGDLLVVEVTVEELKEKSAKLSFKVMKRENADLLALGHLVIVAVDKQTEHATRIPVHIAGKLRPFAKQIL